ncbi:MAG: hypothetical protein A3C41_03800 [Alphaproteobacteria bacterium RIFCSPHIGHO2_02_FULL_42_30]|nr:MAG: hypothetical protein A3C41_03800 [Alphaproteobacteria bacterium RIFCSPHIGHO2_02_FULL_42_30]
MREATESVMISSYSVTPAKLFREGIDRAIVEAASRGVQIYIYYQNLPWLPPEEDRRWQDMIRCCERFEENDNHAKCLIQDKFRVTIGSYNWLSETNEHSINHSLALSGRLAFGLGNDVWQGIKFYQNLKYENSRGIGNFLHDADAFSTGAYQFKLGEFLYTLRTPDAHQLLLEEEVFAKARREIVICSPFIRLDKLKQTLTDARLRGLEAREVRTHLFTLTSPCDHTPMERTPIFRYLDEMKRKYPHFSYSTHSDIHAKTIIADDLICEGSFNLLSAVRDLAHEANNFEMSVAIRGKIAAPFISDFMRGDLGRNISPIPPIYSSASSSSREEASVQSSQRLVPQPPSVMSSAQRSTPCIQIFSGASYNRQGFCARLNGEYIEDSRGNIAYFPTRQQARLEAEEVWSMK